MNFKLWIESYDENRTKNILSDYPNKEQIIDEFKNITTNQTWWPILAIFYKEEPNLKIIKDYMEIYFDLEEIGVLPRVKERAGNVTYNNKPISFQEFKLIIKNKSDKIRKKRERLIFSNEKFDIYKARDKEDCIALGREYSYCISKVKNNAYQRYRRNYLSTFYFVKNKTKPENHPHHFVVINAQRHNEIEMTDANNHLMMKTETNYYLNYLKENGVDITIFKHKPLQKQEIDEKFLKNKISHLEEFKLLDKKQINKYIESNFLEDDQFEYVFNQGYYDIIEKYVLLHNLSEKQFKLIKDTKFKDIYINNKLKSPHSYYNKEEYQTLTREQKANNIKTVIENNDRTFILELIEETGIKNLLKTTINRHYNLTKDLIRIIMSYQDKNHINDIINGLIELKQYDLTLNTLNKVFIRGIYNIITYQTKANIAETGNEKLIEFLMDEEKNPKVLKKLYDDHT